MTFRWIIDARNDLTWYIGSALVGYLYAGLVLLAVLLLPRPLEDAFGVLRLGGLEIPLTLHLLVYASWAFLLDAPHLFSTMARTFFDPEERALRRKELWLSWGWFLVGPVAVLLPFGAMVFLVFFRLWAYYHVVRQHWGFFILYKRKNGDKEPRTYRIDQWYFNLALYLPLLLFVTGPVYARTPGMPSLGLERLAATGVVHVAAWALLVGSTVGYIAYQIWLRRQGQALNGPKLLFLASVVPLHLLAVSNPWTAALLVPIITVGHNLQYHRIVWMYGQGKYVRSTTTAPVARVIFSRFWVYAAMGLLFTLALYRGPWIEWLQSAVGMSLDRSFLAGIGMMAGLTDPSALSVGQQVFATMLLGWAMQHYYLDSKIWRVSRDRGLAEQLRVN
ncbi:MAG TPA: hypothetical protein VD973_15785 [Symbiobacteriaceae bacterium]|nr:hypothetical protein [Symbiobacteriaceae bacterium]